MKSILAARRAALNADNRLRREAHKAGPSIWRTLDSIQNFAAGLGYGTDNIASGTTYGFNPITRIRTLLEWIYRGTWLGGAAVDVIADDMTRAGVTLKGQIHPEDIEQIEETATQYSVWPSTADTIRWSRLYGGSLGVLLIDGQDLKTPLRIETIGRDQFRGIGVLDRWQVEPSLENLVTAYGPHMDMPKFYRVTDGTTALYGKSIHHTRCMFRLEGYRLPKWQRVMENLWGLSVYERGYDCMTGYNSATQGASQLVFKSYIRTYKMEGLREVASAGGAQMEGFMAYVNFMRQTQSNEGITCLDSKDEFESDKGFSGFSGIEEVITQLGEQLAGWLEYPLVRLFGQSPRGFSTGDTDLINYYDSLKQKQERHLKVGMTNIYRAIAQSEGIKLSPGFGVEFRPLWQMKDIEKADAFSKLTDSLGRMRDAGLPVTDQFLVKEIKQASAITGYGTNITDDDIDNADDQPPAPQIETAIVEGAGGERPHKTAADSAMHKRIKWHGLDIEIENPFGSTREGTDGDGHPWSVKMSHDYGYVMNTLGADGDQIDCFIGHDETAKYVYCVRTLKPPDFSEYDEDKYFIDFPSERAARSAFFKNYDRPEHFGSMNKMSVDAFIAKARKSTTVH